jgi:hypothetical protein
VGFFLFGISIPLEADCLQIFDSYDRSKYVCKMETVKHTKREENGSKSNEKEASEATYTKKKHGAGRACAGGGKIASPPALEGAGGGKEGRVGISLSLSLLSNPHVVHITCI